MIPWTLILKNGKIIVLVIVAGYVIWHVRNYIDLKKDNKRLSENSRQERTKRKNDSVIYSEKILTQDEFIEDMNHNHQDYIRNIKRLGIELKQIQKLVTSTITYRDTLERTYVLNTILDSIRAKKTGSQYVVDSTDCHSVKGYIHFDGKDLSLNITEREFANINQVVVHKEKVGLRFWKWFRKKKVSVSITNSCGKSETKIVDVIRK